MPQEKESARPDWDPEQDRAAGERGGGLRSALRYAEYERLRELAPVAWTEQLGGYFTLTRYADVTSAALDTGRFRSGVPFIQMPDLADQIPISLNPPEHQIYRRMLNHYFLPERMRAFEPMVSAYAALHVGALLDAGEADAISVLCRPLPARVLADFLHLPEGAWQDLLLQFNLFDEVNWDPGAVNGMILGVFAEHIGRVVAQRVDAPMDPDDDMLSGALAMTVDGRPLSHQQVIMIGVQMIAAGHATTADSLGSAVHRLAVDPALQNRLRAHPSLLPQAVEEFLRIDPPLHELGRTAATDSELHERTITAGCPVGLNFAAANRDPAVFADPDTIDIERSPNRHLSFGHGIHKCIGAPLARLEMRVVLAALLSRTSHFELAGEPENDTGLIGAGLTTLPLRVRAG